MPRGSNLTQAHQQRAGRARAAGFTREFPASGGRARGAQCAAQSGYLAELGRRGAAVTRTRYGWDFLCRKLGAYRARRAATSLEAVVAAALASLGAREGQDYRREVPVAVLDGAGLAHLYLLDFAFTGRRYIEADGWHWHRTTAAQDRDRDLALAGDGWQGLRLSEALLADPAATKAAIYRWLLGTGGLADDLTPLLEVA